jgi:UDPglucose 6-dehydrogenase
MKISIFGTGYVGLVTGVCFAEMGNEVVCADLDTVKIEKLNRGISPIYEPGLDALIETNRAAGRVSFTTDLVHAVEASDLIFIAVGTPPSEDGSADMKYVLDVANTIGKNMRSRKTIVNKSTVPVGTGKRVRDAVQAALDSRGITLDFDIVSNPEFLKEGTAIEDCLKPARIVLGCESERSQQLMHKLYDPFVRNGNPIHFLTVASAEMTKYAANAMLATKISLMNEFSRICEAVGADIEQVRQGIGSDPRIGPHFIYAGLGYGGSCFPKDVKALVKIAKDTNVPTEILDSVESVNQSQRERFFQKILSRFQGDLRGVEIALWGLAFKPGTDDVREAPALFLIEQLLKHGATVRAYDPVAGHVVRERFTGDRGLMICDDQYSLLEGAYALCVVTEWKPFREPNFDRVKTLMRAPVVFDGRNLYSPKEMSELGFEYHSIGRGNL